ncbi:MAG: Ger(x)C family spore germination protein [Bacillota bacterium]
MRKFIFITYALTLLITGCSNIREVQFQAYAVALGIDYIDHEYHVVLQFLDFTNVAKTEQGKPAQPLPVWLGVGRGKTVEDAFVDVYHGVQIPIDYDQINLLIFGKELLEQRLGNTIKALNSNLNIRLTGYTYGTEEKIEEIFTTKVPFYYPFSDSRINKPEFMLHQNPAIPAIMLQDLIYQFNEETKTILLPRVSINKEIMKEEKEKLPVSIFDGAFIIKGKKMKGFLSNKDLEGFININNESVSSPVIVSEEGEDKHVQIELFKPKVKRIVKKDKNETKIGLNINISAVIRESSYEINESKIKKQIKDKIKNDVYSAYMNSQNIGGDVYQFEDYMYRFMHDDWKEFQNNGEFPVLNKDDIRVKIAPLKSMNKINAGI